MSIEDVVVPLTGHVSPYATTGLAAGTRTPAPTAPDAEQLGYAVRAYVEKVRREGSVWHSEPKIAVLRSLRGKRAWDVFGEAALTAAASHPVHACCRFGYARLLSIKLNEPAPKASPALDALLGKPCDGCRGEIAAERKAARDDVAGRRSRAARPATSTNALVASVAAPRLGAPRSPDGWTRRASRVPSPEEDRAFLAQMRRQEAARQWSR
jgi:hypothetical protein